MKENGNLHELQPSSVIILCLIHAELSPQTLVAWKCPKTFPFSLEQCSYPQCAFIHTCLNKQYKCCNHTRVHFKQAQQTNSESALRLQFSSLKHHSFLPSFYPVVLLWCYFAILHLNTAHTECFCMASWAHFSFRRPTCRQSYKLVHKHGHLLQLTVLMWCFVALRCSCFSFFVESSN